MKKILLLCALFAFSTSIIAQFSSVSLSGAVLDSEGRPLQGATIYIKESGLGVVADENGVFHFKELKPGEYSLVSSFLGYSKVERKITKQKGQALRVNIILKESVRQLDTVEVFGVAGKRPEKIMSITRLPLRPSEQIQSISVISDQLIAKQGALTMADALRNVVGISTFATYGGRTESLSARGYRGIPTLKNGVRINSNFRGFGFLSDMQGVESIQVIKGSAGVTQGVSNDLGSPSGVINVATKVPHFVNKGDIGFRTDSWGQFRPTFDIQRVLTNNIAFRLNAAYEKSNSFRNYVTKDRVYFNPSLRWEPSVNTTITLEADYLHDSRTPDRGTVNLASDSVYNIYDLPHDQFLGFSTDRIISDQLTYSLRAEQNLSEQYLLRAVFMGASLNTDETSSRNRALYRDKNFNERSRYLGRELLKDKNYGVQFDIIGKDIVTGPLKHTFQLGVDYRSTITELGYYDMEGAVDTIDVLKPVNNNLSSKVQFEETVDWETDNSNNYGFMAQSVSSLKDYLKLVLGLRYSSFEGYNSYSTGVDRGSAWNPMIGIIVSPIEPLNLFVSYTNSTNFRTANNLMMDGSRVGPSISSQIESGFKSEWFKKRLNFNFTFFHILQENLAYLIYDENFKSTRRYGKSGNLRRKGVEVEVSGRLLPSLELVMGYSLTDVGYENSPSNFEGYPPIGAAKHTANAWAYYTVESGALKDLSLGVGAYYLGKRPSNDYTKIAAMHDTKPGVKPFYMPAFTTLNAQIAYQIRSVGLQATFNNILNAIGYVGYYRGGFINPIDPFNVSLSAKYGF